MKKKLNLLGLAALAVMAIGAFAASALAQNPEGLPFALCIGVAALSAYICTQAVSRIETTNSWTPSKTLSSRSSTAANTSGTGTAHRPAINAVTVALPALDAAFTARMFVSSIDNAATYLGGEEIDQRPNPRNERIKPTISPVMAY